MRVYLILELTNKTIGVLKMINKSEFIKQYSVKIKTPFGENNSYCEGSGVFIKTKNNCYLATAKHNFTDRERGGVDKWKLVDMNRLELNLHQIEVFNGDKEVCYISKILYEYEDFIIFEIKNHEKFIENLNIIEILNEKIPDDIEYFMQGYSAQDGDGYISALDSRNPIDNYQYILTSSTPYDVAHIKGFSGSGVFIKDREVYYLVGILLKRNDNASNFTIFDLPKFIAEKQLNITPKKEKIFEVQSTAQMYTRMVGRRPKNFLVNKAHKIFDKKKGTHKYSDLNSSKLKELANFIEKTNMFAELEQKYNDELADTYLLGAFILNEYNPKKEESLKYLEKARLFNANYIRYRRNIKEENSVKETLDLGKLDLLDGKYEKAKEYFLSVLDKKISNKIKVDVYELLLQCNDEESSIEYYNELLYLYSEKDTNKRAEAYYQLSELHKDELLKKENLTKAFEIVNGTEDSSLYELEYKITKRFAELYQKEQLVFMMKPILEKLVKEKKEYQLELQTVLSLENQIKEGRKLKYNLEEEKELHENYKFYSTNIKAKEIKKLESKLKESDDISFESFLENLELEEQNKKLLEEKLKVEDNLNEIQFILKKFSMAIPIAILLGIIIAYLY